MGYFHFYHKMTQYLHLLTSYNNLHWTWNSQQKQTWAHVDHIKSKHDNQNGDIWEYLHEFVTQVRNLP